MPSNRLLSFALALTCAVSVSACQKRMLLKQKSGTSAIVADPSPLPGLGVMQVSPESAIIPIGSTFQFAAIDGSQPYIWNTSFAGGTITSMGLYTAPGAEGAYTVTLTDSSNQSAQARVTVIS